MLGKLLGGYTSTMIFVFAISLIIIYLLGSRDDIRKAKNASSSYYPEEESSAIIEDVTNTCAIEEDVKPRSRRYKDKSKSKSRTKSSRFDVVIEEETYKSGSVDKTAEDQHKEDDEGLGVCKTENEIDFNQVVDEPADNIPNKKPKNNGGWVTEGHCRQILEDLFGVNFPTTRKVEWLVNPHTGNKLELDCYNEKLKLALEYNGDQHYKFPNRYNQVDVDAFVNSVGRDHDKKALCKANGVYLIVVPYTVKRSSIKDYIYRELEGYKDTYFQITGINLSL